RDLCTPASHRRRLARAHHRTPQCLGVEPHDRARRSRRHRRDPHLIQFEHHPGGFLSVTCPNSPPDTLARLGFVLLSLVAALAGSSPAHAQDSTRTSPGFGPGASKVYSASGVSIGGYGEMLYENFDRTREDDALSGALGRIDFLRAVIYAGYKF